MGKQFAWIWERPLSAVFLSSRAASANRERKRQEGPLYIRAPRDGFLKGSQRAQLEYLSYENKVWKQRVITSSSLAPRRVSDDGTNIRLENTSSLAKKDSRFPKKQCHGTPRTSSRASPCAVKTYLRTMLCLTTSVLMPSTRGSATARPSTASRGVLSCRAVPRQFPSAPQSAVSVSFSKRNAPRGVACAAALPAAAAEAATHATFVADVAFGVEESFVLVVVAGFITYIALNFEEIVAKQKIATEKAMAEQKRNVDDAQRKQKRDIDAAMKKQAEAGKNARGGKGPR